MPKYILFRLRGKSPRRPLTCLEYCIKRNEQFTQRASIYREGPQEPLDVYRITKHEVKGEVKDVVWKMGLEGDVVQSDFFSSKP